MCYCMCNMKFLRKAKKRIFLDYASITPIAPVVSKVTDEYSKSNFANSSALYGEGQLAKEAMKNSREKIAKVIGGRANEIIFTSGGTESNNLALLGVFESARSLGIEKPHIITTTIEHPAILEVCSEIERRGGEVTYLPVSEDGFVSPKEISNAIKENTVLVTVMFANNEIGTIEPIKEIGKIIKGWRESHTLELRSGERNEFPYFHTDACQAVLYLPLDVSKLGVDLMTLDGIKMYGPRGMGILYVKSGVKIKPILFGGGQQGGLRSGTENVSGIVGLAKAFEIAEQMREGESVRLSSIRYYGIKSLLDAFPNSQVNGSLENRLPNNINICFPGSDSEFIVVALDVAGISVSYSSACRTIKEDSSSYVISALGKENCSLSSLRITLGRETTKKDIDELVKALKKILK